MKKLLVVALMLVVFCGVSLADWQTDFEAWKSQTPEARFQGKRGGNPETAKCVVLIKSATQEQLTLMVANIEPIVFEQNTKTHLKKSTTSILALAYSKQTLTSQDRWVKAIRLVDMFKQKEFDNWDEAMGYRILCREGKVAVKAKVITQDALDALKDEFVATMTLTSKAVYAPERVSVIEVVNDIEEVLAYPEKDKAKKLLHYLNKANIDGKYSDADYITLLRKIIKASVQRLKETKDADERIVIIAGIGGIKTTYKELMELQ